MLTHKYKKSTASISGYHSGALQQPQQRYRDGRSHYDANNNRKALGGSVMEKYYGL